MRRALEGLVSRVRVGVVVHGALKRVSAQKGFWQGKLAALTGLGKGPTGVIKSVLDTSRTDGGRRDEIFVDIVEKISCTFNASGFLQTSQIDGAIQVAL